MKLDFPGIGGGAGRLARHPGPLAAHVTGETRPLTDVLLAAPDHLAPVPCCAATRQSLRDGFDACTDTAIRQHAALRGVLEQAGVTCHLVPARADAPDLCFARDGLATTPWGVVALNPALPHRRREVDHLVDALRDAGLVPVRRIGGGTIEGGDICVAMPGRLIVGSSGERTDEAGAEDFAAPFRAAGWTVEICRFDPHFLHLDTIFCMLDERTALACTDVLDDDFLATVAGWGIAIIPVTYKEQRGLGGNILSIDGTRIVVAAGHDRIAGALRDHGFDPVAVDVSQFTACGGGIHCLTMPVARRG